MPSKSCFRTPIFLRKPGAIFTLALFTFWTRQNPHEFHEKLYYILCCRKGALQA